jgi:hypothetical protein
MCASFSRREQTEDLGFCACAAAAPRAKRDGGDYVGRVAG